MKQYFNSLWTPVNNSQLIIFRILFGLIMAIECITGLLQAWVKWLYVDIQHNFTFIGFEWLKIMHGSIMNLYFAAMALAAIFVALGFLYRYSSLLLAVMWTAFYLSQKTHYNNHYYLMLLLCWIMAFLPANRRFSFDVKFKLKTPVNECYKWQIHLLVFQITCLYVFAAIAKMNSDWLHALPLKMWLGKRGVPIIGRLLQYPFMPWLIAYGGLLFDLLVVPGLLYRRTRVYFLILSICFNVFNALTFRIGTFPYLAVSLNVFFFPAALFNRIIPFAKNAASLISQSRKRIAAINYTLSVYVFIQLVLPLRHLFIKGPVNWTEEGYRLSWRMMLNAKSGTGYFKIVNKMNDSTWQLEPSSFLHRSQTRGVINFPDMTWQAAQYLKEKYQRQGLRVGVYAFNKVRLNGRPPRYLIDTTCDLANTRWQYFGHKKWILLYP